MLRRAFLRPAQINLYIRSSSSIPPPSYTQLPTPSPAISPQAVPAHPAPQAPNRAAPWSTSQRLRPLPESAPRFEQTAMDLQPAPLSAMELINNEPVRLVDGRRAVCDGGGGPLGHPKIFINLDKPGPKPCGYCGIRFERNASHH
ncbi:zinc-finger domain-containing protein [Gautieria morchelliformis]|nr:zinc-finger domain-containing protein [Gautieria morchelliformis]